MKTGDVESAIDAIKNGGWELFDALDDRISKATSKPSNAVSPDDMREIQTAWAAFAATPGGNKALQALIDRTLNRPIVLNHLGLSAEQVALYATAREGQNFVVNVILNQIRLAREEPTKQRDT